MGLISSDEITRVSHSIKNAEMVANLCNDTVLRDEGRVDEIAYLVRSEIDSVAFLNYLRDLGWEWKNRARDTVFTFPIRSSYEIRYDFLENPLFDFRLEIMLVTNGFSPLHSALPARHWQPVHASYKVDSEISYAITRIHLEGEGYFLAQQCDSTYGRFSYWTPVNSPMLSVPYLKPRVNLRDSREGNGNGS